MISTALQRNIDYFWSIARPRDGFAYNFGGCWERDNVTAATDCSGIVTHTLDALVNGPGMSWSRCGLSTENYRNVPVGQRGPFDTVRVADPSKFPADAALKIALKHGPGGGANSHMVCELQGQAIESTGGTAFRQFIGGGRRITNPMFHQWFYLPGSTEVSARGLDCRSSAPAAVAVQQAGYEFLIRYLSAGDPGAVLTAAQTEDLRRHGVSVVAAWEHSPQRMKDGFDAGVVDAQAAAAQVIACGGRSDRPIYFCARWDSTEQDQGPINAYLRGAASVIGTANVGIFGGYWPVSRALDAGTARWGWQTHDWSGSNFDERAQLELTGDTGQLSGIGYALNISRVADYGQWSIAGEGDMFTDTDRQLLQQVADRLAQDQTEKLVSRSPLRALGEGPLSTLFDFEVNKDASVHILVMERLASYGDRSTLDRLNEIAGASPGTYPNRVADINLAKRIIVRLNSIGGSSGGSPDPVHQPAGKHILYTASGTWAKMDEGYPAEVAGKIDQNLFHWQPVDYSASFGGIPPGPADAPSYEDSVAQGKRELIRMISSTPGTFALCGYSQGASVVSQVLIELQSGTLKDRIGDLVGGVTFGNPMRQLGHSFPGAPVTDTRGIADITLTDTPATWADYVNKGDLYTDVPDGDVGADITCIYKAAIKYQQQDLFKAANAIVGALSVGSGSALERLWQLIFPHPNPQNVVAAGQAVAFALQFVTTNPPTLPHISYGDRECLPGSGITSVAHAISFLNEVGAQATRRAVAASLTAGAGR
jgi:hypothetical protein